MRANALHHARNSAHTEHLVSFPLFNPYIRFSQCIQDGDTYTYTTSTFVRKRHGIESSHWAKDDANVRKMNGKSNSKEEEKEKKRKRKESIC